MEESRLGDDWEDTKLQLLSQEELVERVQQRTKALENLMDTMVDVLLKLDPEGRIDMANRAVNDILGYEEGEVIGKPVDYVFASAEKNEELSDMMTRGELLDTLVGQGYVKDVEIYFTTKEGEAIPMSLSASVMEDDDGQLTGIVCVAKDISERKTAEDQAAFLHSLLRHDLSNKLQVIEGNLNMIDRDALDDEHAEFFDHALNGIGDAIELIDNVRTLHKLEGEEELGPTNLERLLREAIDRHEDLRKQRGFTVETEVDGPGRVLGGSILSELFANLVENALVHSDGSTIRVSTRVEGSTVVVTVEDDGRGVPEDEKERILEKGYSGTGSTGSGLGMHLASEIADAYDGDLKVLDSDLGGARFDVHFQQYSR
ncbi:PAS domain-containing sensor histidine kinase [Halobacteriales archaeon QS_8_69_26]|nr:MAG: PAS domain-containing sensor histidine kinase [Halobacteriales archaeon QS_8_69_26]